MKIVRGKIALYQMGEDFDRLLPALSREELYADAEEHVQFFGWANVKIVNGELLIEIPDLPSNDEDELEMPPPRYA